MVTSREFLCVTLYCFCITSGTSHTQTAVERLVAPLGAQLLSSPLSGSPIFLLPSRFPFQCFLLFAMVPHPTLSSPLVSLNLMLSWVAFSLFLVTPHSPLWSICLLFCAAHLSLLIPSLWILFTSCTVPPCQALASLETEAAPFSSSLSSDITVWLNLE